MHAFSFFSFSPFFLYERIFVCQLLMPTSCTLDIGHSYYDFTLHEPFFLILFRTFLLRDIMYL